MRRVTALWLALFTAAAAASDETTVKCYSDGAWGDVCRYTNVCFEGGPNDIVFRSDNPAGFVRGKGANAKIRATTKLFREIDGLPDPHREVPMHYKRNAFRVIASWDELATAPTWSDETVWIPSYFEDLANIWYFSSRLLPVFTSLYQSDVYRLPPPERILLFASKTRVHHSW